MASTTCPHCTKELRWKLLKSRALPGERRFLPGRAVLVCPYCDGALYANPHPIEFKLLPWISLSLVLLIAVDAQIIANPIALIVARIAGSAVIAALLIYARCKYPRNWPCYTSRPGNPDN